MFEIAKIRARRLKTLVIYVLVIYGTINLVKGCQNGTFGYETNKTPATRIEYFLNQRNEEADKPISLLETKLEDMYLK